MLGAGGCYVKERERAISDSKFQISNFKKASARFEVVIESHG
jgi:hypothetical protein